ncbi:MAG: tRNA (guanosine(37)-N1)-methyltransferase TrmD [Clostridia bacterium]|nr:tRNA (guanosine(37)-N1)-methyltransferase TrmD [Clostridia bacterium]
MKFIVLTLFPNMFETFVSTSIIKRTIEKEICTIDVIDIRNFTQDKHNRVDFPPFGGGNGMIISCEPLAKAIDFSIEKLKKNSDNEFDIIYLSPRGKVLEYKLCKEIADSSKNYILICGHYEGIDERIIEEYNIKEISIGDYVLTGGELASQVLLDSVIRLLPGALTDGSLDEESHTNCLLEYPQYTKPVIFRGREVPDILLSGHHKKIAEYRQKESIRITKKYRPDFLENNHKI